MSYNYHVASVLFPVSPFQNRYQVIFFFKKKEKCQVSKAMDTIHR